MVGAAASRTTMTEDEARHVLGVGAGASAAELRAVYVALVRANHPDVAADPATAGPVTATITEAYRVLRDLPPVPPRPPPAPSGHRPLRRHRAVDVIAPEAVWIDGPPIEAYRAVVDAADALGEISYVDRSAGLVQVALRPPGGPTCWLTVSLHHRPGGSVAVCTLESIEAAPTPPAEPVIRDFARFLTDRLTGPPHPDEP
jgi:hypothetical protein